MNKNNLFILFISLLLVLMNFLLMKYLFQNYCLYNTKVIFGKFDLLYQMEFQFTYLMLLVLSLYVVYKSFNSRLIFVSINLILIGYLGNFAERLINGVVCDYINVLGIIFLNINDLIIISGITLLIYDLFKGRKK